MALTKAQKKRLDQLKKEKQEIESYRDEHRKKYGPTAEEMLEFLHDLIHERGHVEFDSVNAGLGSDEMHIIEDGGEIGTDIWDLLKDMMGASGERG